MKGNGTMCGTSARENVAGRRVKSDIYKSKYLGKPRSDEMRRVVVGGKLRNDVDGPSTKENKRSKGHPQVRY